MVAWIDNTNENYVVIKQGTSGKKFIDSVSGVEGITLILLRTMILTIRFSSLTQLLYTATDEIW